MTNDAFRDDPDLRAPGLSNENGSSVIGLSCRSYKRRKHDQEIFTPGIMQHAAPKLNINASAVTTFTLVTPYPQPN